VTELLVRVGMLVYVIGMLVCWASMQRR